MKTNITTKGWEVQNLMRRIGNGSDSSIDLASHTQILKQQKQLNGKNHTFLSIPTLNVNGLNSLIKRHHLAY
jgi:hypothetical protein